ncbi:aldo/keto reductase [Streptomyces phaeochromogenes]|uniref:aldo/keto reductase n=1 Tax=Streptomyces phaeochromogenes TaxID=1923 RepID=UPI0036B95E2A
MSAFCTGHSADDAESIRTIHRALDLGIGFVPYSPWATGSSRARSARRPALPRTTGAGPTRGSWARIASATCGWPTRSRPSPTRSAPPQRRALAWLLAQGDDIAPIPGTKRVERVEENTSADGIELSAEQIAKLDSLPPPPATVTTRRACGFLSGDPPVGLGGAPIHGRVTVTSFVSTAVLAGAASG